MSEECASTCDSFSQVFLCDTRIDRRMNKMFIESTVSQTPRDPTRVKGEKKHFNLLEKCPLLLLPSASFTAWWKNILFFPSVSRETFFSLAILSSTLVQAFCLKLSETSNLSLTAFSVFHIFPFNSPNTQCTCEMHSLFMSSWNTQKETGETGAPVDSS